MVLRVVMDEYDMPGLHLPYGWACESATFISPLLQIEVPHRGAQIYIKSVLHCCE